MEPLLVDVKMRLGFLAVSLDFQVNFTLVIESLWPGPSLGPGTGKQAK